jgi:hypothetical protein
MNHAETAKTYNERRWHVAEAPAEYGEPQELRHPGWPLSPNTEH